MQGIGLAARPVQRQHELAPQTLPEGVLLGEGFQLCHQSLVVSLRQVGIDPALDRGHAKLLQPADLRL